MTSMVVSLDLIQLAKELLVAPNYMWELQHYGIFLNALEATHWHAFSFNENSHLRLQLQQRGFMNKNRNDRNISAELPHLLEQEVLSLEQLLFTVFRLFCHDKYYPKSPSAQVESVAWAFTGAEAAMYAEAWVERYLFFIFTNRCV
jgi:hypothetical protein